MKQIDFFRELALSFPEVIEVPHFETVSFRVRKKIFATINKSENRSCLKLSLIDQDVFSRLHKHDIFPVPNKWGKMGWTNIVFDRIENELLKDALCCAYCEVAPRSLSAPYRDTGEL